MAAAAASSPGVFAPPGGWRFPAAFPTRGEPVVGAGAAASSSSSAAARPMMPTSEVAAEQPGRTAALFWGICDVKYDPRRPEGERLRLLELGDGKASRFSKHGAPIREKFEAEYCFDQNFLRRAVLVENKRLTHDRFVDEGFAHLRPRAASFARRYTPELAQKVVRELALPSDDPSALVVLKLCNRCRGAGVVVTPTGRLDMVLHKLLVPPEPGDALAEVVSRGASAALAALPAEERGLEEQCLHWWSNECPVFLAEECCRSLPVAVASEPGAGGSAEASAPASEFDGTLRVAFVLRRPPPGEAVLETPGLHRHTACEDWEDRGSGRRRHGDPRASSREGSTPMAVDWLGGYWKLPREATIRPDDLDEGLEAAVEAARAAVVSSFGSVEKRTAPASPEHLNEVYAALGPALPRIFQAGPLAVPVLLSASRTEPLHSSFALARSAAAMRISRMKKAEGLLELARSMVCPRDEMLRLRQADSGPFWQKLPERSAVSYIERNLAVCYLMQGRHVEAARAAAASVEVLPTNSSAFFIQGCCFEEERNSLEQAAVCHTTAIALDPDFKLPYLSLANCRLRQGLYEAANEAARACVSRHPDAAAAWFIAGQAVYQALRRGTAEDWPRAGDARAKHVRLAREAMETARTKGRATWSAVEERMLEYLSMYPDHVESSETEPVRLWKVHGWRP